MKTIAKITIAICILCLFAFAQTKPKAAVYIKGNPEGRDALRMAVNTFLIKSQKYQMIAVDAIDVVAQEQNRQRGGSVSDEDIAQLGRDAGAQYVCVVERSELDGTSYVSTSIVSVQSKIAELSEMSELPRGERIIDLIERQINKMLGIYTPPEPEPEYTPEYTLEYTPPKKAKKTHPPVEQTYSEPYADQEEEKLDTEQPRRTIRLGGQFGLGLGLQKSRTSSELFGKSYANYEEMGKADEFSNTGLIPGLTLNIQITNFIALATELNYNFASYNSYYGGKKKENFANVSMSYQTIEIPVLLKLFLKIGGYIETGFHLGFPVSSEATVSSGSEFQGSPFKDEFSDFRAETDYGLVFGIGDRLNKNINFTLRLTYPLTKLDKYGNINAPCILSMILAYDPL